MSLLGLESAAQPQPAPDAPSTEAERQEWIYRGAAGFAAILLFWFGYRSQNNGVALLFLAPLIVGAVITALRLPAVSGAIGSLENRLRAGAARAAERKGKFARFFRRPFFGSCLALWRWTAPISDVHLRSGVRVTALIFTCAIAITLLVTDAVAVGQISIAGNPDPRHQVQQ
jgi:hypothetical protein